MEVDLCIRGRGGGCPVHQAPTPPSSAMRRSAQQLPRPDGLRGDGIPRLSRQGAPERIRAERFGSTASDLPMPRWPVTRSTPARSAAAAGTRSSSRSRWCAREGRRGRRMVGRDRRGSAHARSLPAWRPDRRPSCHGPHPWFCFSFSGEEPPGPGVGPGRSRRRRGCACARVTHRAAPPALVAKHRRTDGMENSS
jgi:hypothetical protein